MSNVDRDRWSQYILWTILNINLSRLYSARFSICLILKKKYVNMATTRFTASFLQPVKASKIQNERKVNVEGTEPFIFRLKDNQVIC